MYHKPVKKLKPDSAVARRQEVLTFEPVRMRKAGS